MAPEQLTTSYEDYLEAIYDLHLKSGSAVRSVAVAEELGVSKASVARAIKNLREMGYIEQEHYGVITLTETGEAYGKRVLDRHRVLRGFLIDILGVSKETANEEACKLEHCVSDDTMEKWATWYHAQHPTKHSALDEGLLKRS